MRYAFIGFDTVEGINIKNKEIVEISVLITDNKFYGEYTLNSFVRPRTHADRLVSKMEEERKLKVLNADKLNKVLSGIQRLLLSEDTLIIVFNQEEINILEQALRKNGMSKAIDILAKWKFVEIKDIIAEHMGLADKEEVQLGHAYTDLGIEINPPPAGHKEVLELVEFNMGLESCKKALTYFNIIKTSFTPLTLARYIKDFYWNNFENLADRIEGKFEATCSCGTRYSYKQSCTINSPNSDGAYFYCKICDRVIDSFMTNRVTSTGKSENTVIIEVSRFTKHNVYRNMKHTYEMHVINADIIESTDSNINDDTNNPE